MVGILLPRLRRRHGVEHDVTKFGWNAGAGMSFALRSGMTLFVEARYNEIQTTQKFEYVPITVGLKF